MSRVGVCRSSGIIPGYRHSACATDAPSRFIAPSCGDRKANGGGRLSTTRLWKATGGDLEKLLSGRWPVQFRSRAGTAAGDQDISIGEPRRGVLASNIERVPK